MHHEVLLALVGCTGDLVVDTGSEFKLAKGVPFVTESDEVRQACMRA